MSSHLCAGGLDVSAYNLFRYRLGEDFLLQERLLTAGQTTRRSESFGPIKKVLQAIPPHTRLATQHCHHFGVTRLSKREVGNHLLPERSNTSVCSLYLQLADKEQINMRAIGGLTQPRGFQASFNDVHDNEYSGAYLPWQIFYAMLLFSASCRT
jgi:hypothetical protein